MFPLTACVTTFVHKQGRRKDNKREGVHPRNYERQLRDNIMFSARYKD